MPEAVAPRTRFERRELSAGVVVAGSVAQLEQQTVATPTSWPKLATWLKWKHLRHWPRADRSDSSAWSCPERVPKVPDQSYGPAGTSMG